MKSILSLLLASITLVVSAQTIEKDYALIDKIYEKLAIPYKAEDAQIKLVMKEGGMEAEKAFTNILKHHGIIDHYTYFVLYSGENQVIPDGENYCYTLSQMYENKPSIQSKIRSLKNQKGASITNFEQLMNVFLYNLRERCPEEKQKNNGFGEVNVEDKEKEVTQPQMDLGLDQFSKQLQSSDLFKQFIGNDGKAKQNPINSFGGMKDSLAKAFDPTTTKSYQEYLDKYEDDPSEKEELDSKAKEMFMKFREEHGRIPVTKEDYAILRTMDGFDELAGFAGVDAETLARMIELQGNPNDPENKKELEELMKKYPHLKDKKERPKKKINMAEMMRDAMKPYVEKGMISEEQMNEGYGKEFEESMEKAMKQSELMQEKMAKMNKTDENGNMDFDLTPLLEMEGFGESIGDIGFSDQSGSASIFHFGKDVGMEMFNVGAYKEFKALKGRDYTTYFNEVLNYESKDLYAKRLNKKQYFKNHGCKETFDDIIENNINYKLNYNVVIGDTKENMEKLEIFNNDINFKELDDKCPFETFTPDSYADLKQNLLPTEAMVSINVYKDRDKSEVRYVYSIIKTDASQPIIQQSNQGKIFENEFLEAYKNNMRQSDFPATLYDGYWKGVDQKLQGITKIYLIADGIYHFINIGALPAPEDNYRFIDEKYEIVYLVGPSSLKAYKENQTKPIKKIKIFGGLDYGEQKKNSKYKFKPLSKSASEMNSIASIAKNNATGIEVETKLNCSEDDFMNFDAQVLHMATHSFLDSATFLTFHGEKNRKGQQSSMGTNMRIMMGHTSVAKSDPTFRSGIALTDAHSFVEHPKMAFNLKDGILFSYEIEALNFTDLDLVFLNSCVSGKGDIKNGMGVYGLQRSFFEAGVGSILMSTFNLSDRVSKSFAEAFYTELLNKNKSKSDSFKDAVANIRKKENKLRHWTPYRLIHM